ncbi:hypothetical protein [Streptomyces macrosporus]|uniref:Lipoprotein n=1 Tax=Streptomyces macrosporus TaxID=44032 RepID=A0ABN3KJS6_9ACTN
MRRDRTAPRIPSRVPVRGSVRTAAGALLLAALGGCVTVGPPPDGDGTRRQPVGHQTSRGADGVPPGSAVAPRGGGGDREGGRRRPAEDGDDKGRGKKDREASGSPSASSSPSAGASRSARPSPSTSQGKGGRPSAPASPPRDSAPSSPPPDRTTPPADPSPSGGDGSGDGGAGAGGGESGGAEAGAEDDPRETYASYEADVGGGAGVTDLTGPASRAAPSNGRTGRSGGPTGRP